MNVVDAFDNLFLLYNKCIDTTDENMNFDVNLGFKG